MIASYFHRWERQLASVDNNRKVRPFEWGLEWVGLPADHPSPSQRLAEWAVDTTARSDAFYDAGHADDYRLDGDRLTFSSAVASPFPENNIVTGRLFHARKPRPIADQPVVVVLPQWNADAGGHVGLCQLFARFNIASLRLSMPYHDARKPAELERADFIVSPNVGRTLQANRQAVLDVKRAVSWLHEQGYRRIGIMGTSLGSCLAMISMAHDPRIRTGAFNHISTYFTDVIWRGLSTTHVRAGLEPAITIDELRQHWMPISPWPFIERIGDRMTLLVHALYDLTFPPDLSRTLIDEFKRRQMPHRVNVLPCGHYSTGRTPFQLLDAFYLTKFFVQHL